MKIIVSLLIIIVCSAKAGLAQTSQVHINVLTSESKKLYVDFDNVVKIYVDSVTQKDTFVKCTNGYITKSPTNDSLYILKFTDGNAGKTVITVSQPVNGQLKKRGTEILPLVAITPELKFEKGRFKDGAKK